MTGAVELGEDRGRGNLLALQPRMSAPDYSSEESFAARIEEAADAAAHRGWLRPNTIAVFPEHIGTFLCAAGGRAATYAAPTLSACGRIAALNSPLAYLTALLQSRGADRFTDAALRMKAPSMARIYQRVFARVGEGRGVTVVAGSIALPEPSVRDGQIACGNGHLYNASFVFRPDGSLYGEVVLKAFPTREELRFLAAGGAEELPVFETPAGRTGVLVCADAWFPECYKRMLEQEARIVLSPTFSDARRWSGPWNGYSGWPDPADVDPADIGAISQEEASRKYALAGRLPRSGIPAGMTSCFRGQVWDLRATCETAAAALEGEQIALPAGSDPAVVNLWL